MGTCADPNTASHPVLRHGCRFCSLKDFCWPPELAQIDLYRLHRIVRRTGILPVGYHLFRATDRFTAVYAVRSGCVKTYTTDLGGNEHVHGFQLPGELLGFDAVYPDRHRLNASMIRDSTVCIIPYQDISELAREFPVLQTRIIALMSREFARLHLLAEGSNATQRIAIFLFDVEARLRRPYHEDTEFVLPMTREDIANHLGFSPETMSRIISRLQQAGVIHADRRRIRLLDVAQLGLIAQGVHFDQNLPSN